MPTDAHVVSIPELLAEEFCPQKVSHSHLLGKSLGMTLLMIVMFGLISY